jgi:phosphoribosylaminoimidazole-succinocarboxamide synthase
METIEVLTSTNLTEFGTKYEGKVRDVYDPGNGTLILIATDRHSSFDRHIADIPRKGEILNLSSAFWFKETEDIVPNHLTGMPHPNVMIVKKTKPLKIEAVMRGYLTGVTDTSIWTRYQNGERTFGGLTLSEGLAKDTPLPEPIFDPTTKEATHDRNLSQEDFIREGFVTAEQYAEAKRIATALFMRGQKVAREHGLILVDTKYEFGLDDNGAVVLIDEIHTPDSSRWWFADSYEKRLAAGEPPEFFDKEFLRLWFREHSDPYKDAVLPEAPPELIQEMTRRYTAIYEQMTRQKLAPLASGSIEEHIRKALHDYYAA